MIATGHRSMQCEQVAKSLILGSAKNRIRNRCPMGSRVYEQTAASRSRRCHLPRPRIRARRQADRDARSLQMCHWCSSKSNGRRCADPARSQSRRTMGFVPVRRRRAVIVDARSRSLRARVVVVGRGGLPARCYPPRAPSTRVSQKERPGRRLGLAVAVAETPLRLEAS